MAYATYTDVQNRMNRELTEEEQTRCAVLLDDAAVMIDSTGTTANDSAKLVVSCRMVIRALGVGEIDVPVGATQGSMSGLGYSQSWTVGSGSTGELYFEKEEKRLLKIGNKIGSRSPLEEVNNEGDNDPISC